MSDLVQCPWLGGYPVEMQGQGVIEPGDLAWVSAGEAEASDNWGAPVALEDLKKSELVDLAEDAGVDTAGKTKARLAAEIAKSAAGTPSIPPTEENA
jgi:hypothetical protein